MGRFQGSRSGAGASAAAGAPDKTLSASARAEIARAAEPRAKRGNPEISRISPKGVAANERKAEQIARKIVEIFDLEGVDLATVTRTKTANLLNAHGLATSHGKRWTRERVKHPLKRARRLAITPLGSAGAAHAPAASRSPSIHQDGYLHKSTQERITAIMHRRGLKMGDVMRELGYSSLNASLGNAMRPADARRIRHPDLLRALEAWLRKQHG
jgi:hypothetical protein